MTLKCIWTGKNPQVAKPMTRENKEGFLNWNPRFATKLKSLEHQGTESRRGGRTDS